MALTSYGRGPWSGGLVAGKEGERSVKERSAEKADLMLSCLVPGREALGSATQKLQVFAAVDLTADDVGG